MAVTVETLDKLERKITLSLPRTLIDSEVDTRLRRLARSVKMAGFRPGKVPLKMVAQRYGESVGLEVLSAKLGEAFYAAADEASLQVAGVPQIIERHGAPEGQVLFDAVFEVQPEVRIGDLAGLQIEKLAVEISPRNVDTTLEILRKQRRSFVARAPDAAVQHGDRVTIDYEGKIDGEPFEGGKAQDFELLLGENQMLKEFEDAVLGMQAGQSKTFPLAFPANYRGTQVAGKTADFLLTVKKIEATELPALDEALACRLGVPDGSLQTLRANVKASLEREARARLREQHKCSALAALLTCVELDLPKASVQDEIERMAQAVRAEVKRRGAANADSFPVDHERLRPQAERMVRLQLAMDELARANALRASAAQIQERVEELAANYEKPEEWVQWYRSEPQRLAAVGALVTTDNVAEFILSRATVREKTVSFEELMTLPAQPVLQS